MGDPLEGINSITITREVVSESGCVWAATSRDAPGCIGTGNTPDEVIADFMAAFAEWRDAKAEMESASP